MVKIFFELPLCLYGKCLLINRLIDRNVYRVYFKVLSSLCTPSVFKFKIRRFFQYIILSSDFQAPLWERWAATGVRQWRVVGAAAAAAPWLAVPESGPPWGAALLPPPSHRLLGKAGAVQCCCQLAETSATQLKRGPLKISAIGHVSISSCLCKRGAKHFWKLFLKQENLQYVHSKFLFLTTFLSVGYHILSLLRIVRHNSI